MARALPAPAAPRRAAWLSRAAQAAYAAGGALAAVQLLRLGARLVRAQVRRNGAAGAVLCRAHCGHILGLLILSYVFHCINCLEFDTQPYACIRLPRERRQRWTPLEEDNTPTGCLNAVGIRVSGRCALSSSR